MGSRNASSCRNASSACWRRAPSPRRGTHPWSCVRGEGRWASARKPVQCASLMIPFFPVITLIVWVRNTLELVLAGAAQFPRRPHPKAKSQHIFGIHRPSSGTVSQCRRVFDHAFKNSSDSTWIAAEPSFLGSPRHSGLSRSGGKYSSFVSR